MPVAALLDSGYSVVMSALLALVSLAREDAEIEVSEALLAAVAKLCVEDESWLSALASMRLEDCPGVPLLSAETAVTLDVTVSDS